MSTAGLSVFCVVFVALEFDSEKTITSPSAMLVMYAPSRYPSMSFFGPGSRSITVVAATSVGFSDAVRERRITSRIDAPRARGIPVGADGQPHTPLARRALDRAKAMPVRCGR